jgi:hypothetical protein
MKCEQCRERARRAEELERELRTLKGLIAECESVTPQTDDPAEARLREIWLDRIEDQQLNGGPSVIDLPAAGRTER